MPKIPETIAFASVRDIGTRLRARDFSCVELTEFFLGRLKTIGPKLNAVATVTQELATQQAEQADRELKAGKDRGPLHGIPYGAKDLLATKGIPTSWGAAPFSDRIIDTDSTVVARLREAGAVLIGKLAMVEIAGGLGYRQANASFTGPGIDHDSHRFLWNQRLATNLWTSQPPRRDGSGVDRRQARSDVQNCRRLWHRAERDCRR
jgi:aspartyl-tRNA(Asn)/glutamyl-tRNA(Gln) amidotransferase subunit A